MEITTQLQVDQAQIEDALRTYAAKWPAYGVLKDAMSYSLLSGRFWCWKSANSSAEQLRTHCPLPAGWKWCIHIP